ncbi:MAG: hypothetical protein DSY66_03055 [Persephonella sp.]|nr:MAG: hypothetical protein DSY66_03055 [Persephonella sp.]
MDYFYVLKRVLYNYKLARFIFALSLTFAYFIFQNGLSINKNLYYEKVTLAIFLAYTLVSFISIFISSIKFLDFLLDIVFISAILYFSFFTTKYFYILYVIVLAFAGLTLKPFETIILTFLVIILYLMINLYYGSFLSSVYITLILNIFTFIIISFVSIRIKNRITKQEEYIKKLEKEKSEIEAYKKLYRLSAELAHEIRNPLASITGAAQLLQDGYLDEKLIGIIKREAKRLDDLLSDFIAFARPINQYKEKINLKEFIEEIVESYNNGEVDFEIDIPSNLEIYIDKKGFFSTISNIIKNAIEWAKSKIKIKAYKIKNNLVIEVEDDGMGINEDYKDLIFEPFFTKKTGGTGLGLAIAKRFVVENNGNIFVEKGELGGAKFIITLPIEKNIKEEI